MTATSLYKMPFLPEDDIQYLAEDSKWLKRLSCRITSDEKRGPIIDSLTNELLPSLRTATEAERAIIMEKVFNRGAENTYLSTLKINELDFNQRKEIEGCFVSTVIRFLILEEHASKHPNGTYDPSPARNAFKERILEEYADFLAGEHGSSEELTWLFRFERAIMWTKKYTTGNRNKGLFMVVGNMLEGSDDYTRYVTGGHSSKETKRRVQLVEHVCDIKPRKRTKKPDTDDTEESYDRPKKSMRMDPSITDADRTDLDGVELPQSIAGYSLDRIKEENGIFRIYEATKKATDGKVILKLFNKEYSSNFFTEVNILTKLNQQDYVHILQECSESSPSTIIDRFIAFENIGHRSLLELVKADEMMIINVSLVILEIIQFVHRHSIIIRNLRLDSICFTGPEHNLQLKLTDLTHAIFDPSTKQSPSSMPSSSSTDADVDKSQDVDDLLLSQTPICQSPELYSSQTTTEITSAADIWSFGMIFFILMTGYFPVDEVAQIQETIDEENQYAENRQMISHLIEKMNRMNLTNTTAISSILMNCFQLLPSLRSNAKDLDEKIRLAYGKASSVGPIRIQPSHVIQTFPLFYQTICLKMTIRHFNFIKEMNEKNKETTTTAGATTSNNLSSMTHHNNGSNSNLQSFEKRKTKIWKKIIFAIMAANRFQRGNNTNNNSSQNNSKGVSNNDDNLVNITTIAIDDKLVHRGRYTKIGKLLTTNEGSIYAGIITATNTKIFMKNARMKSNHRHGRTDQETELELSILKILNNHPQIAKFYDCIDEYPNKFLIIERQDDGILSDLLNDDSFLMTERLLQSIAKNLLYSLHFIHSKQILMRGLSLFSVSMRRISEFELSLKIWNFQTAAFTDVSGFCQKPFPASFHSIVDPSFLAPELLQIISSSQLQQQQEKGGAGGGGEKDFPREPYSFPVDFWSLGVLLYSLIEKRSPFTIGNANMVSDEIMSLQNGSRKLSFENKSISTEAQEVVRSLLTRSFLPAKTSDALRSWLRGEDCYPFPQTSVLSFHPSSAYGKSSASTTSNIINSSGGSSFPGNATAVKFPPMISASPASLPVTAMPPAAPLPAAPAVTTTTTAGNLSTATTLKMPPTTIKANDSPLDVQNAETKLKFFLEQFVDHQRYYVKYFQFVAACNQEDYDLADSLYEELIAIDRKGEDKIAYKDPAAFQAGMKECIVLVDQLDEYYKSPVHANERVKAFSRRKELKADKEKFQEALARVTPGSSSSSFSAQV